MKRQSRYSCAATLLIAAITAIVMPSAASAQHFGLGTELVSRYVWRGTDYGESAALQPTLTFEAAGLEIGTWASYSLSSDGADANEHDVWIGYTLDIGSGSTLSAGLTDYYFPAPDGAPFFDFSGGGEGSHLIEPYVALTGPTSFPLSLLGAIAVHNDPDNSLYLEANLPVAVDGVELGLAAGAVAGKSDLYGTNSFSVVNVRVAATRTLTMSQQFGIPVTVAYILNPVYERSFLVIGFSIRA